MTPFWQGFKKQADLREDVQLQPHQVRAGAKMHAKGGVLAYHGLGSGKTLTSLAATQGMKTDAVVPAALRENYRKETKKFTTGHRPNVQSYEQHIKSEPKGEALVLDEGQMAGRADTLRSKVLQEHAKHYANRMVLSGTPIRNHPSELAPIMNIVRGDSAFPTDQKAFSDKFIAEDIVHPGFFNRVFRGAKPGVRYRMKNRREFEQLIDGYVDYHAPSKEHFPSTSHEVVEVPMSDEQMQYYKYVLGKAGPGLRWKIKRGMPPSKTEASQLNSFLTGARQVANSTQAFGGKGESTKIQSALQSLDERMGKDKNFKGLVYSNFLDSGVKTYAAQLEKRGVPYGIFDGSLSDKKRKEMVNDYNDGKLKVLLVSGAGAQGIDLKGTKLVQLLEPHWNNPRLEQAMGRAIRYKSHEHLPEEERHVHVQRFHSTVPKSFIQKVTGGKQDKSVDQYLDMLSSDKEKLNEQFLAALRKSGGEGEEKQAASHADRVESALAGQQDLHITYRKMNGRTVKRHITPLKHSNGRLTAYDHKRKDVRSFIVERIRATKIRKRPKEATTQK